MSEHPIEGLMTTAMNNIKDMVDVNTIIGEPIETSNNVVIIPISKVSFGFAAGGSEFKGETIGEYSKKDKEEEIQYNLPFGRWSRGRSKYKSCCLYSNTRKWRKTIASRTLLIFR
jgi:sporulation protein YtfJ